MLTLHIEATTISEFNARIQAIRPVTTVEMLEGFLSEDLLTELRQRLAPHGVVVRLRKYDDEDDEDRPELADEDGTTALRAAVAHSPA